MGILRVYVLDYWRYPPLTSVPGKSNILILIDQAGNARIADFGLLTIILDPANPLDSAPYTQRGMARWMSPELIDPQRFGFKDSCPTTSSDCYALGMVIYETICGHIPFHDDPDSEIGALVRVLGGELPPREDLFADNLWKMLKKCWSSNPKKRPSIGDVLQFLERPSDVPSATKSGILAFLSPKSLLRPSPSKLGSPMNPPLVSSEVIWNQTVEADKGYFFLHQEVLHTVSGD